jgi:serine/threonine-protein kinase
VDGFSQGPQWAPGTLVGEHEIVAHIASGGMAEVYAAVPRRGGEPVVLKAMSPALTSNEEFVRLFFDEAQLIATLHHHNICQIFDRGEARGAHYFIMEYVLGPSCREILNRAAQSAAGHIPLSHAIDICCAIADALHYAHGRRRADGSLCGIVHRDVSPSNVLVTYEGVTKLIDFGVAKSSMRSTETKVGSLKGKIRYMSPEQIRGEAIDQRSDLFALGIMLWEMTTGQRLFRGANEAATMHKILYEDARRPSDASSGYPPELEHIVLTALDRDPRRRQPSAEELGAQLADFATRAGLTRGGLSGYLQALFGEEREQDQARFQLLCRRRSAVGPAASATSLRPPAASSPTSRRHRIAAVAPLMAGSPLLPAPPAPAMTWPEASPISPTEPRFVLTREPHPATHPRNQARQTTRERLSLLLFALVVIGIIATGLALSRRTISSPMSAPRSSDGAIAPPPAPASPESSEASTMRAALIQRCRTQECRDGRRNSRRIFDFGSFTRFCRGQPEPE